MKFLPNQNKMSKGLRVWNKLTPYCSSDFDRRLLVYNAIAIRPYVCTNYLSPYEIGKQGCRLPIRSDRNLVEKNN